MKSWHKSLAQQEYPPLPSWSKLKGIKQFPHGLLLMSFFIDFKSKDVHANNLRPFNTMGGFFLAHFHICRIHGGHSDAELWWNWHFWLFIGWKGLYTFCFKQRTAEQSLYNIHFFPFGPTNTSFDIRSGPNDSFFSLIHLTFFFFISWLI